MADLDPRQPTTEDLRMICQMQATPLPSRDRCGSCGRFLRADSLYTNRCSDCWTPDDEFWF